MSTNTNSATVVFTDEDHTLGGILRYCLVKNEDVTFAGYSIPHPAENKMNMRIQTNEVPVVDALKKSATLLKDICNHITSCAVAAN